jgi:hypothetical protein
VTAARMRKPAYGRVISGGGLHGNVLTTGEELFCSAPSNQPSAKHISVARDRKQLTPLRGGNVAAVW